MICRNCLQRATVLGRRPMISEIRAPVRRTLSTTAAPRQAAPANDAKTPSPSPTDAPVRSSCPPGTVLNGLNYLKGKTDPVALRDEEYPEWLWSCVDVMKKASEDDDMGAGDEFCTFTPLSFSVPTYTPACLWVPSISVHREPLTKLSTVSD